MFKKALITTSLVSAILVMQGCSGNKLGDEFNYSNKLSQGYKELGKNEFKNMRLKNAVDSFSKSNAIRFKHYTDVDPRIPNRDIPESLREDYILAYDLLMALKDSYASVIFPKSTAAAQIAYECWLDGANKLPLSRNSLQCKEHFNNIVDNILVELGQVDLSGYDVIYRSDFYFDFNSIYLSNESKKFIEDFARDVKKKSIVKIIIDGHADAKGNEAINAKVSLKRANSVKDAFIANGFAAEDIMVRAHGSKAPLFESSPKSKEMQNRVVSVMVLTKYR